MTNIDLQEATNYYRNLLSPLYANRKFIHIGEIDIGVAHTANLLTELGAAEPILLAGNRGTSSTPLSDDLRLHLLGVSGDDMVDSAKNFRDAVENLPSAIRTDINAWDPHGEAHWVCQGLLLEMDHIAGRSKYGRRKPSWTALEDKTTVDSLWDHLGIKRADSIVVNVNDPHLAEYARDLDRGRGTVWVPDNREGVHGGSVKVRWVRTTAELEATHSELRQIASQIRIMPFLEGVPVSIHCIVFPEGLSVLRPVELIVLRRTGEREFLWGGCSTGYDPSAQDRAYMREVARTTGEYLRTIVKYRGPISIDGILSEEGFLPTELNPRLSGGFAPLLIGLPDLPLAPLCWAAMEDEPLDYQPEYLETVIVQSADKRRHLRGHVVVSNPVNERETVSLRREGEDFYQADVDTTPDAKLTRGPSPLGAIYFLSLLNPSDGRGVRTAPELVRALRFTDRHLGTNFGGLESAREVRPSGISDRV